MIFPQPAAAAETPVVPESRVTINAPVVQIQSERLPVIQDLPARRTVAVMATAYTSSVDETDGDPWTTASGAKAGDGIIAANGLAFGTRVRFPDHYGDKIFVVQDRMNPRYGSNYVDLWMPSKSVAKEWGVRKVRMEIL